MVLAGFEPLAGSTSTTSSAFSTISRKRSMSALIRSIFSAFSASSVMPAVSCWIRISSEPPSLMSVPRPAMLVAIVIAPGTPASATI